MDKQIRATGSLEAAAAEIAALDARFQQYTAGPAWLMNSSLFRYDPFLPSKTAHYEYEAVPQPPRSVSPVFSAQ